MDFLCLYAKAPKPGETKGRLANVIGNVAAAALSQAMLSDLCHMTIPLAGINRQLWIPPENQTEDFFNIIPPGFTFHQQQGEHLGARMSHTFQQLLTPAGSHRAVIIGSDCITHNHHNLLQAFAALKDYEIVIQPACDGGYVLIGQSQWHPELFTGIDWGSGMVYSETLKIIEKNCLSHLSLPVSFDIDTIADLERLRNYLIAHPRPETARWMNNFYAQS